MIPRKVLILTGSRAEYGLLRPVLAALDREPSIEVQLAAGGSHLLGRNPTIDEIRAALLVVRSGVPFDAIELHSGSKKARLELEEVCGDAGPRAGAR